MNPYNGILLVDKPAGMSSFGVVARVRGALSRQAGKKIKVGHTGTLDPFATGLMIIVVGEYCKRAGEFSKLDKSYQATICLGKTSSTGDPEGEITVVDDRQPTEPDIETALAAFRGSVVQTPPAYSAIKINGQRAYKLAREGKEVEMPTRQIAIYWLEMTSYEYPTLEIDCDVSSGTYIRTLAADIGAKLGTGAYTQELRRTKVGKWDVASAVDLEADFAAHLQLLSSE